MLAVRSLGIASLPLFLALAAVGCGSGGNSAGTSTSSTVSKSAAGPAYSLERTKTCLHGTGANASSVQNPAISGSRGDLKVTFGYGAGALYLAFGKDAAEARALENRAISLAVTHEKLDRATVLAGVRLRANVFYYSANGPVSIVLNRRVTSCLR